MCGRLSGAQISCACQTTMLLMSESRPRTRRGFPGGSDGKEPACNAGDPGLIPGSGKPMEKGMATYSSIPAWRIPWTEEPGGPQSMGSQRVGHD